MPSRKARAKFRKGEELLRLAVLPLKEIIREYGSECPEAVEHLEEAQEIFWTRVCQLTDEDQGIKEEYLAGEHDGGTTFNYAD